jgi:hypothetical protein
MKKLNSVKIVEDLWAAVLKTHDPMRSTDLWSTISL